MSISLWKNEVPLAIGHTAEDVPTLVPYLLDQQGKHGAIIICPGGGYVRRADHEGEPVAKWLNSIGLSAFVLHYRVSPYKHPAPLIDAQRAIKYVRHHADQWNIDSQKIGILGFSAGGHVASTAATLFDYSFTEAVDSIDRQSARPDLAILCYPVISFTNHVHQGSIDHLLGEQADRQRKQQLSSEYNVTAHTPPVFLWHTADDASVPVENSFQFALALRTNNIPFECHIYQTGRHGLGLASESPDVARWTATCEVWLRKQSFI